MTWWMFALLILLYLFIGAVLDFMFSGDPGENIWVPMVFWPFIIVMMVLEYIFKFVIWMARITVNGVKKLIDILSKIKGGHRKEEDRSWAAEREERDTTCDKCDRLNKCIEEGRLIESTTRYDTRRHYIVGIGNTCANVEYLDKTYGDWRSKL